MSGDNNGYPMRCRNWLALPHRRLYDDIHSGPGVDGTRTTQDTYARIGDLFARTDSELQTGLARIGVAYTGSGSDAAQSGISVLQQWTTDAQMGSHLASAVVEYQATGYSSARDTMPEPVEVTAQDGFFDRVSDFFGGTTPREEQEAQAREAHIRAAQVMGDYDLQSGNAAGAMPTFVPPPAITVDVPAPQNSTTTVNNTPPTVTQTGGPGETTGTNNPNTTPVQQTPTVNPNGPGPNGPGPNGPGPNGPGPVIPNPPGGAPTPTTPVPTTPVGTGPVVTLPPPTVPSGTGPGPGLPAGPPPPVLPSPQLPSGGHPPGPYPPGPIPPGTRPPGSGGSGPGSPPRPPVSGPGGYPRPPGVPGIPGGTVPGSTPGSTPGGGPGARPGGGYGPGAFPPGAGARPGGGDYDHVRRPGLTPRGFGPGGFDPAGRAGFGPGGYGAVGDGFGPRGGTGTGAGQRFGGLPDDHAANRGGAAGAAGARGGAGGAGFMQPAAPGSGNEDDQEHRRKYVVETDKYFADDRLVPPPVIGENNQR